MTGHPTANILISSGGRRVGLFHCFRDTLVRRGQIGVIAMADAGRTAPLAFVADRAFRVPRCSEPGFIDAITQICLENSIRLVVPTIDTELPLYADAREKLAEQGILVAVSGSETIAISGDKVRTYHWLLENNFPTVRQTTAQVALDDGWAFPLIAKPPGGSASAGVRRVHNALEMRAIAESADNVIVQEIAQGREYTINVYVNRAGDCVCAVPHWRIETRGGEVSKGLTAKDPALMQLASCIARRLPDAWGALNVQCMKDSRGDISIIEINARFGGGYPLAHHAGAWFTDWLLEELEGKSVPPFDAWTNDLAMLRYDEAVYLAGSELR